MKNIFLLILTVIFLSSCTALNNYYVTQTCNTDAAYAAGVNDAKNNIDMKSNYATSCPVNQPALNAAYRNGYQFGLSNSTAHVNVPTYNNAIPSPNGYMCLQGIGGQVCGYDCKTSFGVTKCASYPGQQCLVDNFGKIACGYQCLKSINEIKCARNWGDNCVMDNFGDIKCGVNCRLDFGQIKCDRERYM